MLNEIAPGASVPMGMGKIVIMFELTIMIDDIMKSKNATTIFEKITLKLP